MNYWRLLIITLSCLCFFFLSSTSVSAQVSCDPTNDNCPPNSYCDTDKVCKSTSTRQPIAADIKQTQTNQGNNQSTLPVKVKDSKCTIYGVSGPAAKSCPASTICDCPDDNRTCDYGQTKEFACWMIPCSNGAGSNEECVGGYLAPKSCSSDAECPMSVCDPQTKKCQALNQITPNTFKSKPTDCTMTPNGCSRSSGQLCDTSTGKIVTDPAFGQSYGVLTAIGCVPTDIGKLTQRLVEVFVGLAGGVALILMLWGAIEMILSRGDTNALKSGQGRFTSAILGLVFILFSIVLLRIIGVDILGLNCITGGVFGGECKL